MNNEDFAIVGEFEITGTDIHVTDPCYEIDTWCAGTVEDCLPGKWIGFIEKYEDQGDVGWYNKEVERLKKTIRLFEQHQKEFALKPEDLGLTKEEFYGNIYSLSSKKYCENQLKKLEESGKPFRVKTLIALHESIAKEDAIDVVDDDESKWQELDTGFGVDSGQMMIGCRSLWDEPTNKQPCYDDRDNGGEFTGPYADICDITCGTSLQAGIWNGKSVVSRSGYGDGGYPGYVLKNKENQVVGIKVQFIGTYDDDDRN